jgi:hypothetical protein
MAGILIQKLFVSILWRALSRREGGRGAGGGDCESLRRSDHPIAADLEEPKLKIFSQEMDCWRLWRLLLALQSLLASSVAQDPDTLATLQHQRISNDWKQNEKHWQHKSRQSITFVFLGDGSQESLLRTIHSIRTLTNCSWSVIILYSVPSPEDLTNQLEAHPPFHLSSLRPDSRISYFPTMNAAQSMGQFIVRRIESAWLSVLEIGDQLSPDYFQLLRSETNSFPTASSFIFQTSADSLPPPVLSDKSLPLAPKGGHRYALKYSVLTHRQVLSSGTLSELVSAVIVCSGSSVLSSAVPFLSRPSPFPPERQSMLLELKPASPQACRAPDPVVATRPKVAALVGPSRKHFLSRFLFPEERNLFFAPNVRGLREALLRSHALGCIDPRLQVTPRCAPPPRLNAIG